MQTVSLPTDCSADIYLKQVVAIGRGHTSFDKHGWDKTLHSADLTTFSMDTCEGFSPDITVPESVICAYSTGGQLVHFGDSGVYIGNNILLIYPVHGHWRFSYSIAAGGPLLFPNKTLIGVTSYTTNSNVEFMGHYPHMIQTFTSVQYFYDWISKVTGLELPKC